MVSMTDKARGLGRRSGDAGLFPEYQIKNVLNTLVVNGMMEFK